MLDKNELNLILSALDDFQHSAETRKHDTEYINKIRNLKLKVYDLQNNLIK